jgi:hypothetical protein
MQQVGPRSQSRTAVQDRLVSLDAMALLAHQTGSVIHVIVPRGPGVVARAQAVAEASGVAARVDLLPNSIRVRFSVVRP